MVSRAVRRLQILAVDVWLSVRFQTSLITAA
ncbi:MAG: hypothetical protein BWY14_00383 [Parcubacteria group bacterium ADurb.Bin192]|nr:MAG: hypothetical protein BWY14_00383 [Parcubacteria group bacterium ADurb.Bin192]